MSDLQTSQLTSTNAGAHSGASAPQPPNTLSQELPPALQPDPEQEQVPVSSTPNPVSGGPISSTGTPCLRPRPPWLAPASNAPTSLTPVVSSTSTPVVTATSNAPTSSTDTPVVTAASYRAHVFDSHGHCHVERARRRLARCRRRRGRSSRIRANIYTPPPRPPVVRREKEKRSRRKSGDPPGKRGPPSWVWGTKLRFFESRKDDYETASEKKLGDDEDFAVDVADPPDWVANKVVNEKLTPEEEKFRQEFYTKLRDRLGQCYSADLGRADGNRHVNRNSFISTQEKRYEEHIKSRVEARKCALAKRAELSGVKAPHAITVQNEVTKECWEEETYAYQQEMVREREREHDIRVKAWKESMADGPNRTPEEFSASLKSAAHYLQPFVDTIAEWFGMCVSILMVGPIGERGGRIEMRSVHSGKMRGVVEKDWPLHDPEGFTRVQSSMVEFGHHVFSRAECEARVTLVQEPEEPQPRRPVRRQERKAQWLGVTQAVRQPAGVSARQRQAAGVGAQAGDDGGVGPETNEGGGSGGGDKNPEDTTSAQAGDDGGVGPEPNEGEGSGGGDENPDTQVEKLWKRRDAAKWTVELTRAHTAFECGKTWGGIEWASLVDRFFDFEAAWGFVDTGGQITTEDRPDALDWWISRGRKWEKKVDIRGAGRCEDARDVCVEMVELLHGKDGMLQIMVSLLWWGERVADGSPADAREWSSAVEDVAETFREMLRPGVIAKFKKATERGGTDAAKGKKRKAAEGNDKNEGSRRSTRGNLDADRPMKRPRKGRGN
ncbi:hypothetical protein B0H14DRAFT_3503888 [Mycena olivaceomarginata]|nr:hypothetical protein B0H14DRAFT_3503888 [Mycena olivaceomarginata]